MSATGSRDDHPSVLTLDRHALGIAAPEIAAHLDGCETCRSRIGDAAAAPVEVPAWARQLGPRRPSWLPSWSWRTRGAPRGIAIGLTAFACVVIVWVAARRPDESGGALGGYVGTKGGPELRLFVKRGTRIAQWDPAIPVVASDLLRLEVQPDHYTHVSVFEAARAPGTYELLYDGAIAPGLPTALPAAWRVDEQPGDEVLAVVLGAEAVKPGEVARLLAAGDGGRHWTRRLVVAKAIAKNGADTGAGGSRP